ncbi:MAG: HAD-IC family P-type ATPase [Eubacterium sp.]|nr:HAD-IC family P-type ATPase [Eubacterium sp.]
MNGLNEQQVRDRMRAGAVNVQADHSAKTELQIVKENIFTYFNLIFAVLAILVILVKDYRSLTFMVVVIANMFIGIFQEISAKRVLDKLSLLNQPTARVLRDGEVSEIAVEELVLDDIILLTSGCQIPADACVVDGEAAVNESLLTGEADEIEKKSGDTLMSGSFVVSGKCYARLTAVGEDSYINGLMHEAGKMKKSEQSEMVRDINRIVIAAGIAIIPIGIGLFYQSYYVQENDLVTAVQGMVAAVVGMIPEGLYLLVTMVMAVSAAKLARKQVMLHDMKSIETLARVDVLCLDKTGTITDNDMQVRNVVPASEKYRDGEKFNDEINAVIGDYIAAVPDDNQTMQALREYFTVRGNRRPTSVMSFSSKYKYSSVAFDGGTYVLGAPEMILSSGVDERAEELAAKGYRVLAFARVGGGRTITADSPIAPADDVEPIGYICLLNPLRKNAAETIDFFKRQSVDIRVISGDNPVTVSEVAKAAGIEGADRYVDCRTLKTAEDMDRAAAEKVVFGRTSPDQKRMLVRALKRAGHTVAMTGDGVNDILAMKSADCSVAMASGSDAASQAAQVVILDSDFSRMPQVVAEGRQTINNLERSATLFLVKNIFSFLLALFTIFNLQNYPLAPSQVSLISMFNIGLPAFLLAMEPNNERVEHHFLRRVLLRVMPAALTNFFVIAAMVRFSQVFGVSDDDISVAATFLMAIVGFMILIRLSVPLNKFHVAVIGICMVGFALCGYFLHDLFAISYISRECVMLFVLFAITTEPSMRYLTMLFDRIGLEMKKNDAARRARESSQSL